MGRKQLLTDDDTLGVVVVPRRGSLEVHTSWREDGELVTVTCGHLHSTANGAEDCARSWRNRVREAAQQEAAR